MSIALDLGTSQMRSLRRADRQLVSRSYLAEYAICADDAPRRRLLERAGIPFSKSEGHLLVAGEAAAEFAQMCQVQTVSLWRDGELPHNNPPARQLIANIVEALLPEPQRPGQPCVFTVPGGADQQSPAALFVSQLVRLKGYEPIHCRAAAALALAELSTHNCSGLAMSCGAGSTEVSLWWLGRELASCAVRRGGDWIDEELARRIGRHTWDAAGNVYLDCCAARRLKAAASDPEDASPEAVEVRSVVRELYAELIDHVLGTIAEQWRNHPRLARPLPVTLVCGGGAARWPGFAQLLHLRSMVGPRSLPVSIQEIRLAAQSDFTVARGCLIAAELESTAAESAARAA